MVNSPAKGAEQEAQAARDDAPQFEKISWRKEPNMRKLYFWAAILCVASATTGFDGCVSALKSSHEVC
jgi:hypothetical protein